MWGKSEIWAVRESSGPGAAEPFGPFGYEHQPRPLSALSPAFSVGRLVGAGLSLITALLIVAGSNSPLYEWRFFGIDVGLRSIIQVSAWDRSRVPFDREYSVGVLTSPAFGAPLLAAALTAAVAVALLVLSIGSAPGSRLIVAARLAALATLGLLAGTLSVLVPDLIYNLERHGYVDRLVTSSGSGIWYLAAAVVFAVFAVGCAAAPGADGRQPSGRSAASVASARRVRAASMLILAGLAIGSASTLTIVYVGRAEAILRFTGWTKSVYGPYGEVELAAFGYGYLAVAVLLVLSGAAVALAARGLPSSWPLTLAHGLSVVSVAGAIALVWAMAVNLAWLDSEELAAQNISFAVGWGFWLLVVGACLALLGGLVTALAPRGWPDASAKSLPLPASVASAR